MFHRMGSVRLALLALLLPGAVGAASAAPLAPTFTATAQSPLAAGTGPVAAVVGLFDAGTVPDVAFADAGNGTAASSVAVRAGSATGTFSTTVGTTAVGIAPSAMLSGYFNVGVNTDLVVTNQGSNSITALFGDGTGAFPTSRSTTVGKAPSALAAGDINRDGYTDLAVANSGDATISLLRQLSSLGRFNNFSCSKCTATVATGTNPSAVALADINGDTSLDLLATGSTNTLTSRLGAGDGTFGDSASNPVGSNPTAIGVGDINGDGFADAVVANQSAGTVSVFTGSATGTLTAKPVITGTGSSAPDAVVVGDLNGDTIPDLAVAWSGSATVGLFTGNGDGTFVAAGTQSVGTAPSSIAEADLNGDGRPDLVVTNQTANTATVLLNTTAITTTVTVPASINFGSAAIGATIAPIAQSVVVASNAPTGYQLSMSRSAFSSADIPQSVSLATVPTGGTRTLAAGTASLLANTAAAIGQRTGSVTPAGGDTWGIATGLGPIPFGLEGSRTSTITYTVVTLP
jgi:hypothetical protein